MIELLVDTSVAIPLVVSSHKGPRLAMDRIGGRRIALAGHAPVETYAVLTRLPEAPRWPRPT